MLRNSELIRGNAYGILIRRYYEKYRDIQATFLDPFCLLSTLSTDHLFSLNSYYTLSLLDES